MGRVGNLITLSPDGCEATRATSQCLAVGYDGAAWNGQEWLMSAWNPCTLKVGDVVQIVVTTEGDLRVSVNGKQKASHRFGIPSAKQLFALVELCGNTSSVLLRRADEA